LASGMARPLSSCPAKAVNVQGPSQLNQELSGANARLRFNHIPGTGRALLERIRLDCQPGPHHRSISPAPITQLPKVTAANESSKRILLSSCGSKARLGLMRTAH